MNAHEDEADAAAERVTKMTIHWRCTWCWMPEDVTQHAPGHDDEPESDGRHRFRPAHSWLLPPRAGR